MRYKFLLISISLLSSPVSFAKPSTQDCLKYAAPGLKSWQVVKYCGKPPKFSLSQQMPTQNTTYQVYQYPITEAICYTMPKQKNVICDADDKGDVSFYFANDTLKQIEINDKVINDIFLKFNQKIVLGDDSKHLFALWGKPATTSKSSLKIPTFIEYWHYNNIDFIIIDGVVTKVSQ